MRNHFSKLAYAAGFALALTFTLSCSSNIDNGDSGGLSSSSSSGGGSSSSSADNGVSSSSSEDEVSSSSSVIPSSSSANNGVSSSSSEDEVSSSSSVVPSSSSANNGVSSSSSEDEVSSSSSVIPSSSSVPSSSSSITYTLACAVLPPAGMAGTAITPPTVTCNGAAVYNDYPWTGAPDWSLPDAGIYNVSATATCGGSSQTASCGTLTVNAVLSKGNNIANYRTVQIGTQIWMAENLDYNVSGSKCYDNRESYCAKYGRLYNWATAMALDASCNFGLCASQVSAKHRGICPYGWHIPSEAEWNALSTYVQSDKGCTSCDAKHLKSTNGWNNNGNGLDSYGFSALPGGYGISDGIIYNAGDAYGRWWSSENDASDAYGRDMGYRDGWSYGHQNKYYLLSVRCLQDSSSVPGPSVTYGGETYQTVVIGTQTWFRRNLNYAVEGSKCGNGSSLSDANTATCDTYGRLYDWATAMALPSSCNSSSCYSQIGAKHRGICPSGWHIPSGADWNVLMKFVNPKCIDDSNCAGAGTKLKSASGWNLYSGIPVGTDDIGFSALPGGNGNSDGGFYDVGSFGYWWGSSENDASDAYSRGMSFGYEGAVWSYNNKDYLQSVRCLKD